MQKFCFAGSMTLPILHSAQHSVSVAMRIITDIYTSYATPEASPKVTLENATPDFPGKGSITGRERCYCISVLIRMDRTTVRH
jgi:hypothetical protein